MVPFGEYKKRILYTEIESFLSYSWKILTMDYKLRKKNIFLTELDF